MKASELTKEQSQTYTENQPTQINSKVKRSFIVAFIVVLLIAVIAGLSVYYLGNSPKDEKGKGSVSEVQGKPQPSTPKSNDVMMVYKDPEGRFTFLFPTDWKILDEVPERYRYVFLSLDSSNKEQWLKSKMIWQTCRGPVLQNVFDPDQLIVFEVVENVSDGGFCWSSGYFTPENQWKIEKEAEWRGDYMIMRFIDGHKYTAYVSLINYETFEVRGEKDFYAIVGSFQFAE